MSASGSGSGAAGSTAQGAGRKRGSQEAGQGSRGGSSSKRQHQRGEVLAGEGRELPGAGLGEGPVWSLVRAWEKSEAININQARGQVDGLYEELEALRALNARLLEQALSCGDHADVRFELDDGSRLVGGHRAVLCCASVVFGRMFSSGMKEADDGIVRMRGVKGSGVRGLVEWLYLGRAGEECKAADGRELWVLSEMYDAPGLRAWLVGKGLDAGNVGAACAFGLVPEGDRRGLVEACGAAVKRGLGGIGEENLARVGGDAAVCLVQAFVEARGMTRKRTLEAFRFVERWHKANAARPGCEAQRHADRMVGLLDLSKLSPAVLKDNVKPSGLVNSERLDEIYEGVISRGNGHAGEADDDIMYEVGKTYGSKGTGPRQFRCVTWVAVHGEGAEQRLAAVDYTGCRVHVFGVESGECVATIAIVGPAGYSSVRPVGAAFNARGELFVGVYSSSRCEIRVFDRGGGLLRSFGAKGTGQGQLGGATNLASTPDGDLVVSDYFNHRVQVFREDGTFVLAFGSKGSGDGQFQCPRGVAVGADGAIAVADLNNDRVQVFDSSGRFVRAIGSQGYGAGQFPRPYGVAFGVDGEIFVSDYSRNDVQIFDREGALLHSIGAERQSDVELPNPIGVAVDGGGRVFVACNESGVVKMLVET